MSCRTISHTTKHTQQRKEKKKKRNRKISTVNLQTQITNSKFYEERGKDPRQKMGKYGPRKKIKKRERERGVRKLKEESLNPPHKHL